MTATKRVPVVAGLFTEDADGARLTGSRCAECDTPYFPRSARCHHPDCGGTQMHDATFGPYGTLWSYSVQNYPPPPPAVYEEPYQQYALAVVDLDDGLRVVGRLTDDPNSARVGAQVELVVAPLCHEDDGSELVTWMFRLR